MAEVKLGPGQWKGWTMLYPLLEPHRFRDHAGRWHTIPAGFWTDGASFPRWLKYVGLVIMAALLRAGFDGWDAFLWSIFLQSLVGTPVHRAYTDEAVEHDYLYSIGCPKAFADCHFFRAIVKRALLLRSEFIRRNAHRWWLGGTELLAGDVIFVYRCARALAMYLGVALGGWPAYLNHRRRLMKGVTP